MSLLSMYVVLGYALDNGPEVVYEMQLRLTAIMTVCLKIVHTEGKK